MTPDECLMREFQQGSAEAFSEIFRRYQEPVYHFFRRRLNHSARAEELAQETFLAVLHGLDRYQPRASFRTYLYSIAFNLLWTERRKSGREANELVEVANPQEAEDRDTAIWIRDVLGRLTAGEREVLLLREYELSYAEMADVLRVPVNTVRSRLFRARMALKDLLVAPAEGVRKEP